MKAIPFGLVADVGGTNTRLARVDESGVIAETVVKRPNAEVASFRDMALDYIGDGPPPNHVVVAVAGPVEGDRAALTNCDWNFEAASLARDLGAGHVHLINDLEALGYSVASVPDESVEALHDGAEHGHQGQALVVGLGTGFNVSPVDTRKGAVLSVELGHASMPGSVRQYLATQLEDISPFQTIENLFSGVGMLRLAKALGLDVKSAAEIGESDAPGAREAVEICTMALSLLVKDLAFMYRPLAGMYFNGSLAKLLLSDDRRDRVLAPLRANRAFDAQIANIPAFLFVSDTVALGGCAARLLATK